MSRILRTLFGMAALMAGCANFQRSSGSGYGVGGGHPITIERSAPSPLAETEEKLSLKTRLKQLENTIHSQKELEQYSKVLPYLKNDSERIEFLELADFEARQQWLVSLHFVDRPKKIQENLQELVDAQDIAIGMPQILVHKSWGEPERIEVSGNPLFHNELWKYSKYVSTPEGYKLERKTVYFDGGKVTGWEVE